MIMKANPVIPHDEDCNRSCNVKLQLEARIEGNLRELSLLFDVSMALNKSRNLDDVGEPILKALHDHMGMVRGMLALLDTTNLQVVVQEAFGLTPEEKSRAIYQIGEGIIGRVVESGKAMFVPRISEEPSFLDRTGSRQNLDKKDIAFMCAPVMLGDEVIGAIAADRLFSETIKFEEDLRLLQVVGSMLAQALKVRQEEIQELDQLRHENQRLHSELKDKFRPSNIIGSSRGMTQVYHLIQQVAPSAATVLVRGENGVGKELVAQAIHYSSPRADKPFVAFNCSAVPENLIESELFGHEKGAFTGADRQRKGRFEMAHGGTLFLDEIGDITPHTQVQLLRVLQERRFERLGGAETIECDVRVIAATNRPLEELMEQGTFREDLFYRLNVFPVYVPSLKERKSDIPSLLNHFIDKFNKALGKEIKRISTPAIDMLMAYHWPGNVRELENCIERACILCNDEAIAAYHLPPTLQVPGKQEETKRKGQLPALVEALERDLISDALKMTKGNITKAAEELGITERMMGIRVRKYSLHPKKV